MNTDKTAATKTDAKGQIAAYTYDSLKRVIQITRSTSVGNPVACAQTNYYYYANPVDPSFTQYATGRLATVITGNPYCTPGQITEMYSYNGSGGITKKRILVRHPHKVVIHDCRQLSAQL